MSWLRAYCDPPVTSEAAASALTDAGIELERIERLGVGDPARFVVGRVLSAERHPDADRLRVCEVDDGTGEARTIVCGAPNVAAGQTVAVALPGAVMPDGTELGEAKLRGVRSSGMILAEDEVGLGDEHGGIMVLSEGEDGAAPGTPLAELLPIAEEVLELEISPNRPDCLGVYGVARELHAVTGAPLAPDPTDEDAQPAGEDRAEDHLSVEVDPEVCLRFTVRVFEDVTIAPSPLWLRARLVAAGQRPISNVVDITNYVMLLTGQPLHAFDLDRVRGARLVVHGAEEGQTLETLDGVERRLSAGMALISDGEGPTSLAGIMGGAVSEVADDTTRVAMEAATWVGPNIMRTSGALGLRSEASGRFEKQLHPEQAIAAQRLAARLMVDLCGARAVPGVVDVHPRPAEPRVVRLRAERVARILGQAVPADEIRASLGRLGFEVADAEAGGAFDAAVEGAAGGVFDVTVPYWRDADVQREADLVEEVARMHGLDRLPTTLPARRRAVGRLSPKQRLRRRLEDALRDRGLFEAISWSFVSPDTIAALRLGDAPLMRLANPLSADQSVMRPLVLPGLLDAARHNAAHGRPRVALFESAHVYEPGPSGATPEPGASPRGALPARERHHLAALLTEAAPRTWRSEARAADFYAAKGLLEAVTAAAGVGASFRAEARPFLHPGRAAAVLGGSDERPLGWVGELHPLVARAWDLEGGACFEVDFDLLAELAPGAREYTDLTTYPAVVQDIAVVVPEDVTAAAVEAAVRRGGGILLRSVELFDVYRGEQVGEGSTSLALRLEFRSYERTLTDEDVAEARAAIEAELAREGGRLRA